MRDTGIWFYPMYFICPLFGGIFLSIVAFAFGAVQRWDVWTALTFTGRINMHTLTTRCAEVGDPFCSTNGQPLLPMDDLFEHSPACWGHVSSFTAALPHLSTRAQKRIWCREKPIVFAVFYALFIQFLINMAKKLFCSVMSDRLAITFDRYLFEGEQRLKTQYQNSSTVAFLCS